MENIFKGIQVNESISFLDVTLLSCFVKIINVSIPSLGALIAMYDLRVFKTKEHSESHPEWAINISEISNSQQVQFIAEFTQGDLFHKISEELKNKLLELNPSWIGNNLIIEE